MSTSVTTFSLKQYNTDIKPLTTKQLAFVSAYIANGGNGTQAIQQAGYHCKSQAAYAKVIESNLYKYSIKKISEISGRERRKKL